MEGQTETPGMHSSAAAIKSDVMVFIKLNTQSPWDPAIPLLGRDPKGLKRGTLLQEVSGTSAATWFLPSSGILLSL